MVNKNLSPSASCGARLMHHVLRLLVASEDGSMPFSAIRAELAVSEQLTTWEGELYEKSGQPRWLTFLTFYATRYLRAGLFLRQQFGVWAVTEAGAEAVASMNAVALFLHATELAAGKSQIADPATPNTATDPSAYEDFENKSRDDIMSFVLGVDPYVFQNMVAALLRGMGYHIPFVAPKGKDGGVDVIAYSDPLGATRPILKVQVKHYKPDNPVPPEVVRGLLGVCRASGDTPIVVTSGRFSDAAKAEARQSNVRLIDGDEFVSLWVQYFDSMPEEDRSLMPIRPFWFIKRN